MNGAARRVIAYLVSSGSSLSTSARVKRRAFAGRLGGTLLAIGVLTSRRAYSQSMSGRDLKTLINIASAAADAQDLLVLVTTLPLGAKTDFEPAVTSEIKNTSVSLSDNLSREKQQFNYVAGSEINLALVMQKYSVPLVPSPDYIIQEFTKPLPNIKETAHKSLSHVIWDIFWDTLGVNAASKAGLKKLVDTQSEIAEAFSSLAEAVRARNAALTALLAERLLARLFSRGMAGAIVDAVGKAEAAKLLGAIATRFVPFIGWALWVVSITLAIRRNWSDITPFL